MGSRALKRLKDKGQILLLVLVLTFVAATLAFSLTIWSQESHLLSMRSSADLARTRLTLGMSQELLQEISDSPNSALTGTTSYQIPSLATQAEVKWGEKSPQNPLPKELTTGHSLFSEEHTPSYGYGEKGEAPSWYREASVKLPGGQRKLISVRNGLPFAASAPWGSVHIAGRLDTWNNLHFDKDNEDKDDATGAPPVAAAPVRAQAYEDMTIEGSFSYGLVTSQHGQVTLPEGSTGIGISRYPISEDAVGGLLTKVNSANQSLEGGNLDKRDFITGDILSPMGFFKLLTGKEPLTMIFSLQQQCNIPLPMVPSIYNYDILQVIALHNPYPSDFQGKEFTLDGLKDILGDLIKSVFNAKQKIKDAEEVVKNAANALAHIGHAIWDAIRGKLNRARHELERAKDDLEKAVKAFMDAWLGLNTWFDPFRDILEGKGDLSPQIPHTLAEEKEAIKIGFAYFSVLRRIEGSLEAFFKGVFSGNFNALIYDLMNPTRVVHFTDRAPYGGFSEDGGFTLAWTMDVPRGRTLKFGPQGGASSADFVIMGDLWIQRGATLVVDGNLFVQAPPQDIWLYRMSPEATEEKEGPEFRPTGTIYLEEGATLVVSGNLYAEGYGEQRASVVVTSDYGQTPAINSGIICQGDVRLPGGVGPGVTLENLLIEISKDVPVAGSLAKNLVAPLINDVAPHMAKVLGPFNHRVCWFSSYATTFVLIPELVEFGLQGPWPIPIPYSNCMINVFKPLSKISSITLNFTLGDNLITHCGWWIVGEGIVPILPKVEADAFVEAAQTELEAFEGELNVESILSAVARQAEQVIPVIVEAVMRDVIQAVIKDIIGEISGIEDPCADCEGEECGDAEGEEEQKAVEETLGEIEKTIKGKLKTAFRAFVAKAVDKARAEIGEELGSGALREVSGALVYSGGKITIGGEEYPPSAVGLFLAQGDVEIQARHTIGAVSSRTGDIDIQGDLHFNPYFTQAFLYDPQAPDTLGGGGHAPSWLEGFESLFRDAVYLKTPTGGTALDIISNSATLTGQGRTSP